MWECVIPAINAATLSQYRETLLAKASPEGRDALKKRFDEEDRRAIEERRHQELVSALRQRDTYELIIRSRASSSPDMSLPQLLLGFVIGKLF